MCFTEGWVSLSKPRSNAISPFHLTSDGRWAYTWDCENRLVSMECAPQLANTPTGAIAVPGYRLTFTYDGLSRRIAKKAEIKQSGGTTWSIVDYLGFAYDGWDMVVTVRFDAGAVARVASYVWGPDIGNSGYANVDWQKAGGVGGLLMVLDGVSTPTTIGETSPPDPADDDYFPLYDRLGNIIGYRKAAASTASVDYNNLGATGALYDYDAFGRELRSSGPAADLVPFHFSTKFTDQETGLNYYGYRYYDPQNGRWLNRDPYGERGGSNLNAFKFNNLVDHWDYLGLTHVNGCCSCALAIAQAALVKAWAEEWNKTSPGWSKTNQCGEQTVALSVYLDSKIHVPTVVEDPATGKKVSMPFLPPICVSYSQIGGANSPYIFGVNTGKQHHALLVVPDTGGQRCGKFSKPFILDGFKGNPSRRTSFPVNKAGCVNEETPAEFKKKYPYEDPSAPSPIIYHP